MELILQHGDVRLAECGRTVMTDIAPYAVLPDFRNYSYIPVAARGAWRMDGSDAVCDNFRIESKKDTDGALLMRTTYTNVSDAPQMLHSVAALCGRWPEKLDACFYHPMDADVPPNMMEPTVTTRILGEQTISGGDVMALRDEKCGEAIVGFATFQKYKATVAVKGDGMITLAQLYERRTLAPGESVSGDWFLVLPVRDARYALIEYGARVGRLNSDKPLREDVPAGWCSWYYYFGRVAPEHVLENTRFLAKHKEKLPVRYIQTDAGWQTMHTELTRNEKYPLEMKEYADQIRAEGFLPGIWLSPLMITKNSSVYKEHPEWLVRAYDKDEPALFTHFELNSYLLDVTHPGAAQYLYDMMHMISHDWGYRYIKMDYMLGNMLNGRRHDPLASSVMAYRKMLSIIQSAITEDTYYLNCTAPFSCSVGLVDGMRVSGDIFGSWRNLKIIFERVIKRYYMNRTMFNNDADCLIIRKTEQEDEWCGRANTRNDMEIDTYIALMAASGGALMLSDKMTLLTPEQIELISCLFPINTQAAVPLDFWENNLPGVLDFGRRGHTRIISVTNWGEYEKTITVPLDGRARVWEFFGKKYLGECSACADTLLAHQTKVYFCTDADMDAAVVGSSCCICPTITQSCADGVLEAELPKEGAYYLYAPCAPAEADGCTVVQDGALWRADAHAQNIRLTFCTR